VVGYVELLSFIGQVIAYGGGSTAIAYLAFKTFGSKWIESKFATRFQEHKHEQEKEIQRLRAEIDSMLNGVLKLQEREFQVLPEAWEKLVEAHAYTTKLTSPFQTYPDLERLSDKELEEFLKNNNWLLETQKNSIKNVFDKNDKYQDFTFWHYLRTSENRIGEFNQYIRRNGIFFPKAIKDHFEEMVKLLFSATTTKESFHRFKEGRHDDDSWEQMQSKAEPLYKIIEQEIIDQLRSHSKKA